MRAAGCTSPRTPACAAASRSRSCTPRSPRTRAFLRRFRAEAQVAASLHHPHIVTVHDWGEDDVPFMVLELLEGGSLRSMLDQDDAAHACRRPPGSGRDVASALEYAHARGILHRDIKPANLLFDEHGIVRVADFGLARALAEASWTEPAGAVFGTARYASPEQAMGVQLDARSDLYSLALVLVEAVTGKVPFSADTTIGMLTARTQRSLTAPDELGPLAPVVERAGRIDADERYPDAATMRAALADVGDVAAAAAAARARGHDRRHRPAPDAHAGARRPRPQLFDQDAAEVARGAEVAPESARSADTGGSVPFVVAVAVVLVTVALAAVALAQVGGGTQIEVPGLVGLHSCGGAKRPPTQRASTSRSSQTGDAPDPAGTVIAQSPAGGTFTDGDDGATSPSRRPRARRDPRGRRPAAGRRREPRSRAPGFVLAPQRRGIPRRRSPTGIVYRGRPAAGH